MKRQAQIFIFLAILTLGYYIINKLLLDFFSAEFMAFPMAILLPISILMERTRPNIVSRFIYIFSMTWTVFLIYSLIAVAVIVTISILIDTPTWLNSLAALLALSAVLYGLIRGSDLKLKKVKIPLPVEAERRFVQISDVHLGTVRSAGFLKRLSAIINETAPEAVFITGDLLDGSRTVRSSDLSALKVNAPVFFVSGNHDTYSGDFRAIVEGTGIKCIDQTVIEFEGVQIVGVGYSMTRHCLAAMLDALDFDPERPVILLHHLPVDWSISRMRGVDLQLSGHTHAGQFYPFNILVGLMFPFIAGLYEDSGSFLYVSQGTGTWGPPVRIGSFCEVTVIDLVPVH